jgi:two-component system chemotaxis sensor kinase CheA
MEIDRQALVEVFLAEAEENLSAIESSLLALETSPRDAEALATVFRAVHTLKGNSTSLGFTGLGRIAHAAEDLLDGLRRGGLAVSAEIVTLLLAARDRMRETLEDAALGRSEPRPEHDAIIAEIARRAGGAAPTGANLAVPSGEGGTVRTPLGAATLRVGLDRLDQLLTLTGEIAVSRLRLESLLEAIGPAGREALEAHDDAERLFAALQELVFATRMVPLGSAFRQHQRTVRDLASAQGKQVRLQLSGEDVEVDTSIVDLVRDALTHMIRNAVDHGIESPETRAAAGKSPVGTVSISAHHEGGNVLIQVADDGAGLDRRRIRERAVASGVLREDETVSDGELLELVFLPGFTTSDAVTGTSGRGVGMDVVRRNVERMRGTVLVESTEGQGTTVRLRLPLTVASISALRVQVGAETYVLPMEDVVECLDLDAEQGLRGAQGGVIELRGRPLPYLRLRQAIGASGTPPERENVVVVRQDRHEAGFAVDAVLGTGSAVIRPLGRFLRRVPGVAGSVILGSGEVALVLDVGALLKQALWGRRLEPVRTGI